MATPEIETIWRQMHDLAAEEYRGERRVRRIRVTRYAIPGSITILPVPEEREWSLPSHAYPYDPRLDQDPLEILMHPQDWNDLRRRIEARDYLQSGPHPGDDRVMGIPVTIDH